MGPTSSIRPLQTGLYPPAHLTPFTGIPYCCRHAYQPSKLVLRPFGKLVQDVCTLSPALEVGVHYFCDSRADSSLSVYLLCSHFAHYTPHTVLNLCRPLLSLSPMYQQHGLFSFAGCVSLPRRTSYPFHLLTRRKNLAWSGFGYPWPGIVEETDVSLPVVY